jgi:hypothetical protein
MIRRLACLLAVMTLTMAAEAMPAHAHQPSADDVIVAHGVYTDTASGTTRTLSLAGATIAANDYGGLILDGSTSGLAGSYDLTGRYVMDQAYALHLSMPGVTNVGAMVATGIVVAPDGHVGTAIFSFASVPRPDSSYFFYGTLEFVWD